MIYAALLARFSADKGLIPKPSKSRFYCVTGMQQRSDEAMAVFRVERNKGYTVMSNHHLRNKELSLKAKGLLSQMLSLPEDWDYTLAGLSFINREKIDAIREAVKELERAGYIVRSRERDEKGRLRGTDYVIFEQPQTPPVSDLPTLENPTLDNPTLEKPTQEKPTLENPTQLNKDIQKTDLPKEEKINTDLSSTDSIPIHSLNPLPYDGEAATPPERKRKEATDAFELSQGTDLYFDYPLEGEIPVLIGKGLSKTYPVGSTIKIEKSVLGRPLTLKVQGVLKQNAYHSNYYALNSKTYYNFSILFPVNEDFINHANMDIFPVWKAA